MNLHVNLNTIILHRTNEMNTHVVYSTTHLIILIWHALKIAVCMLVNTVFAE